jgi:hypothetical protein
LLNISNNHIAGDISAWMKPPRQGLKVGHLMDGKCIVEIYSDGDIKVQDLSGIIALADAIKDMRAMTSLNLASNELGVEGAKIIAACLAKCT